MLLILLLCTSACGPETGGPVLSAGSAHVLVLGRDVEDRTVRAVASAITDASPAVDVALGTTPRRVLALVGPDRAELTSGAAQLAAAAITVPGRNGYLVIDGPAFATAGFAARRVLLGHEITHLRLQPVTAAETPLWLVEGIAEVIGYRTAGLTLEDVLASDPMPGRLPTDAELKGVDAQAAYHRAWATCAYLSTRLGLPALVEMFRTVASATDPSASLASQLHRLGLTTGTLPGSVDSHLAGLLER